VNVPLNVSGGKTIDWQTHAPFLAAQQAVQKELSTHGRILVRPSGTEPLLRIMVEAPDKDRAKKMAERLVQSLQH
jgi:phosphoglucosamine mutase